MSSFLSYIARWSAGNKQTSKQVSDTRYRYDHLWFFAWDIHARRSWMQPHPRHFLILSESHLKSIVWWIEINVKHFLLLVMHNFIAYIHRQIYGIYIFVKSRNQIVSTLHPWVRMSLSRSLRNKRTIYFYYSYLLPSTFFCETLVRIFPLSSSFQAFG